MRNRLTLIVAAALPLAGCISLGPKTPPSLYTLTADAQPQAGPARTVRDGEAVAIGVPTAPQTLLTMRVAVQASPTAIAYLKDAQWAAPPSRLFRDLLAQTITARTGRFVIDPRTPVISPGVRLTGSLAAFGLDAQRGGAVVIYDATLSRGAETSGQVRRFEGRAPVAALDAASAGPALNQAANQVATQVAEWVAGG